ncbi:hypothetical protein [Colwellia sp. PAMC 21821]|uniref:hypothetical protein n=1 Tax=Colwellia sp. PAMC 21821 TaxID=1816219 RepID=UPI0009BFD8BE|nr:hypothetical protein [Colwellia sp. PAMC 21821]ARD44450.1 hypothetical protein A3Q33_09105 [Colwellia sp. PAMC 21821]
MSVLGFSASDLINILQLGISGVAFVFLAMSYTLLRKEQEREQEPRDKMLSSIRQFSILSFAFAILVAGIGVYDNKTQASDSITVSCQNALDRAEVLSATKSDYNLDTLHELLTNTISSCK